MYLIRHCFLIILQCLYIQVANTQKYAQVGQSLTEVPNDIPADVKEISLGNNLLTEIQHQRISHCYKLTQIRLMANKMRVFPNFGIGGKRLTYINLSFNSMGTLPVSHLNCLESVTFLDLRGNSFSTFPDFSPVGNTLKTINLLSSKITFIPTHRLEQLDVIEKLLLEKNSITSIEDMSPIGDTLKVLNLKSNKIFIINDKALENMITLQSLLLQNNYINEFPNMCRNNASLKMYLTNCPITLFETAFTECLQSVNEIHIQHIAIMFTDTIKFKNANRSLEKLVITSTLINKLTNIGVLSSLTTLDLSHNTNLELIEHDFFDGWISLEVLNLQGSYLKRLPKLDDAANSLTELIFSGIHFLFVTPSELSKLRNLKTFDLKDGNIPFIPTTCPFHPDQMIIDVTGFIGDLCMCHNLWLKSLLDIGANVQIDTIYCDNLNWIASDISLLYDNCQEFQRGLPSLYSFYVKRSLSNFICGFPTGRIIPNLTSFECMKECLNSKGCYSFNYRPIIRSLNRFYGDCLLVIPNGGLNDMTSNEKGWYFYEFVYYY